MFSSVAIHAQASDADAAAVPEPPDKEPDTKKELTREERRAQLQAQVDALLARDPEQEDYVDDERCISTGRVRDVEVLDDRHVAFRVRQNEYYLVQFDRRCPGLRRGRPVIYESQSSRLCQHDAIRALYSAGPGRYDPGIKCFIPGFQSVTREQIEGLKVLLRNPPKNS